MITTSMLKKLIIIALLSGFNCFSAENERLAPKVTEFDAKNSSYDLEQTISDLQKAFIDSTPENKKDGMPVGELGIDGGDKEMIFKMAQEIANDKADLYDSMLIAYQGKLIFESYYSRGRIDLPHFQMSATKSYTAMAVGRAIQLGYLTMADLDKPIVNFLKDLKLDKLVDGVENITLHRAMTMRSGLNINWNKIKKLRKTPKKLKGQALIQAFFEHGEPISNQLPTFSYQNVDAILVMQVIDAVVPEGAKNFIKHELLDKMGISVYGWDNEISGLPTGAYGSSITSRDMVKWGTLAINKGKWLGEQLISLAFMVKATSKVASTDMSDTSYGYFWWLTDMKVEHESYVSKSMRGGGGQYIIMFEELDLVVVVTAHNKLGSDDQTLALLKNSLLPAFIK